MPRGLTKALGWLLLAGTIGVVSCQALFTSGDHKAVPPPPTSSAPAPAPSSQGY